MLRQRTSTGTQVLTAGQTSPSLQIVSLAGQSGFARTANVHGFASSSTATATATRVRPSQTQTQTRTQTRTQTATAAGAPALGDPGGSRTVVAVAEDEKKKKQEKRVREAAKKSRNKANSKAARQRKQAELKQRKTKLREVRRAEGGCFGRKKAVAAAAGSAAATPHAGVSTPGPRPVELAFASIPNPRAAAPAVSVSGVRTTPGGGSPGDPAGGGAGEMAILAARPRKEQVKTEGPMSNAAVEKKSGCLGFRWCGS